MLGTLGGGSARGMGRGIGKKKVPYNPFVMSWSGGRGTGALYAYSPEAVFSGNTSTFVLMNSSDVSQYHSSNTGVMPSTYRDDIYVAGGSYGSLLALSGWDGDNLTVSRQTNSNYGYNGGYNYASAWFGRTSFGNVRGSASVMFTTHWANSLSSGGWTVENTSGTSTSPHREDATYRAGKYLFCMAYYKTEVFDLSISPYRPDAANHFLTYANNDASIIISPRDNMLGMMHSNYTYAKMWDYDTGTIYDVQHGFGSNNWYYDRNAGHYTYLYAHTPAKTFNGDNYSRSNYSAVHSGYNNSGFSSSTDGATVNTTAQNWRNGTYNAETETMYLVGAHYQNAQNNGSAAKAVVFDNTFNETTQGTNFGVSIYNSNRGPFRGDMFSHKLLDHQIFDQNYYV
ncbi:hypothetical protein CRP738_gp30 [Roseobacter phage CRP-738]|nr:hypothetical protein CRP738_gp30 [Roseobacter phage CRP-738]